MYCHPAKKTAKLFTVKDVNFFITIHYIVDPASTHRLNHFPVNLEFQNMLFFNI